MFKKSVAIQGQKGSYHEMIARQHYPSDKYNLLYLDSFNKVFKSLRDKKADYAVVAIANNRYGFIPAAFSQLMNSSDDILITGDSYLAVKHQLIGKKGAGLEDIKYVHSMSVATGQCELFIEKHLSSASVIEEADTALSVEVAAKINDKAVAAIGSKEAAKLHGMSIIKPDIQDDPRNITRFYLIKNRDNNLTNYSEAANKTTALLKTAQTPGSLVDALLPFKEEGINISTLHSAFMPNTSFDMQFLIEFDASTKNPKVANIYHRLASQGASLKAMGSYLSSPPKL